jgi:hypothetical protein
MKNLFIFTQIIVINIFFVGIFLLFSWGVLRTSYTPDSSTWLTFSSLLYLSLPYLVIKEKYNLKGYLFIIAIAFLVSYPCFILSLDFKYKANPFSEIDNIGQIDKNKITKYYKIRNYAYDFDNVKYDCRLVNSFEEGGGSSSNYVINVVIPIKIDNLSLNNFGIYLLQRSRQGDYLKSENFCLEEKANLVSELKTQNLFKYFEVIEKHENILYLEGRTSEFIDNSNNGVALNIAIISFLIGAIILGFSIRLK